jgi:hypothetical protein
MERSTEFLKLATKKLAIQQVIETATKDTANPYFKSKYADLCEVVNTIKKAMVDAKAVLLIEQYPITEYKDAEPQCTTPKVGVCTRLTDVDSGEWESTTVYAYPAQDTPQAIGSVITYLRRYTLMPIFGVVPEDDDGNAASGSDKMDQRLPADRRPAATGRPAAQQQPTPQAGLTARTPAAAAAELAQRSGAQQTPSNASRRPVAGKGTRKPPTPSANPLPPPKAGHDDLPYTMDEPQNPDGFVPPPLPEENVLIGKSPYDRIVIGIKLKKIMVDKWRKWLMEEYKTDSAQGLSEEQQNAIVDVIYNHPELIDPGMGF